MSEDFLRGVLPPFRVNNLSQIEDDHASTTIAACSGIFGHPEAAKLAYLGIYGLQHRERQESAGIQRHPMAWTSTSTKP